MIGHRNPEFEAAWLDKMRRDAGTAGADEFKEIVERSLEAGQAKFGNAYLERNGFNETIEELRDVATYALLEAQRLYADEAGGLDAEAAQQVRVWLFGASVAAARAFSLVRAARDLHRDAWTP